METEAGAKQRKKMPGKEIVASKVVRPQKTEYMRDGREYPDPTPVAPPIGFVRQPTLAETMRQMVRSEALKRAARESGMETFEEADDFEIGDDYDPKSPYEEVFEPQINAVDPNKVFVDNMAQALRTAFSEEKPVEGQAAPPPEAPTPPAPAKQEGGGSPPPNPLTSFFQTPKSK